MALYRVLNIQREPMSNRDEEKLPRTGDTQRKKPPADPRLQGLTHLPRVSYRAVRFVCRINEQISQVQRIEHGVESHLGCMLQRGRMVTEPVTEPGMNCHRDQELSQGSSGSLGSAGQDCYGIAISFMMVSTNKCFNGTIQCYTIERKGKRGRVERGRVERGREVGVERHDREMR